MSPQRKSARQRLVTAALKLFTERGVAETTTRQIADLAQVNEVTLFRHFGSKHGLLLAVIEEAEVFTQLGRVLGQQAEQVQGFAPGLRAYADGYLSALAQIPEFVRSLVGEAGQYPVENRQAIGRWLAQMQSYTAQYLSAMMAREQVVSRLPPDQLAGLINVLLLGYSVMEFTTEFHQLWRDRNHFIDSLVDWCVLVESETDTPAATSSALTTQTRSTAVMDLPSPLVRTLLQQARRSSLQDYALMYVLFGAGLSPNEVAQLTRIHSIRDNQQHLLQIPGQRPRQVPLNQWIMGYRYGSYTKNPLTQWLKSRKDDHPALFLAPGTQAAASPTQIRQTWQTLTASVTTPSGQPPQIEQAQHTWRVEMLMRGMTLDGLALLSGCTPNHLQPYAQRAQEKAALEQAIRLDHRPYKDPSVNPNLN